MCSSCREACYRHRWMVSCGITVGAGATGLVGLLTCPGTARKQTRPAPGSLPRADPPGSGVARAAQPLAEPRRSAAALPPAGGPAAPRARAAAGTRPTGTPAPDSAREGASAPRAWVPIRLRAAHLGAALGAQLVSPPPARPARPGLRGVPEKPGQQQPHRERNTEPRGKADRHPPPCAHVPPSGGRHIARSDAYRPLMPIARRPCRTVKAEGPSAGPYVPRSCLG